MSLRVYRIISLILTTIQIPIHGYLLFLNLTHVETDSTIVLVSTLIVLLLSIVETFVSFKTIKQDTSALYDLAFEKDGSLNKFAFIVSLILGVIGIALLASGIYFFIISNYLLGVCFSSIGIFMVLNIVIYISFIVVSKRNKYIR